MKADRTTFWKVFEQFAVNDKFADWPFSKKTVTTRRFSPNYAKPPMAVQVFTSPNTSVDLGSHAFPPTEGKAANTSLGADKAPIPDNAPVIVKTHATGSVVFCMSFEGTPDMTFTPKSGEPLVGPWLPSYDPGYFRPQLNTLGPPPDLQELQVIPPSSPRICVGWGAIALKDYQRGWVIHDQYWSPQSSSYSLLPHQQRKTLVEIVTGLQDTTSDSATINASLSLSISGGWGPIAAALNASLSIETQHQHTVQLTQQTTTLSEDKVVSASDDPAQIVYWGLIDAYTLVGIAKSGVAEVVGTIESVQSPPVVKVYPPTTKFASARKSVQRAL